MISGASTKARRSGVSPVSDGDKTRSTGRGRPSSKTSRKQLLTQEDMRQDLEEDSRKDNQNKSLKGK